MAKLIGVLKRNSPHLSFFLLFALVFMLGIAMGSVIAIFAETEVLEEFAKSTSTAVEHSGEEVKEAVVRAALSVCTLVLTLWGCGFLRKWLCFVLSSCVIVFKGMVTGYTTAMLVRGFGLHGIAISAVSILPQYIVLLPLVFCVATAAVNNSEYMPQAEKIKKYSLKLLLFLAVGLLCALADVLGAGTLMKILF